MPEKQPETITFEVTLEVDTAGPDLDETRAEMRDRLNRALKEAQLNGDVEDIGVDYPDGQARTRLDRAAKDLQDAAQAAHDLFCTSTGITITGSKRTITVDLETQSRVERMLRAALAKSKAP